MTPRFYVATTLENHAQHNAVRDRLHVIGHEITYDWTTHNSVWREGAARIAEVAVAELQGVVSADYVVVLLPGGRGTHCELGMALATGKPVAIYGTDAQLGVSPETCAFYHHPLVRRLWYLDSLETLARQIAAYPR